MKLQPGHTKIDKWILVPVEDILTPKEGRICMINRWWMCTKNNEVLFYRYYGSPQCNSDRRLVEMRDAHIDNILLKEEVIYIPTAFVPFDNGD